MDGQACANLGHEATCKDDIKPMYKERYWDVVQGDHLPSGVDTSVADFGVNAGPSRAAKRLQRVVMAT